MSIHASTTNLRLSQKPILSEMLDDLAPSVFISYSQTEDKTGKHRDWVAKLARKLFRLKIKPYCDINMDGSQPFASFIEEGIKKSKYIICICSKSYVAKTRTKKQSGVRKEYDLILERGKNDPETLSLFVIPVLRKSSPGVYSKKVPFKFKDIKGMDFESKNKACGEFAFLVERILGIKERLSTISHKYPDGELKAQAISDAFHNAAAQYWKEDFCSQEEENLRQFITSGDFFNVSAENRIKQKEESGGNVNRKDKAMVSIGKMDSSYNGDNDILSFLTGGNQK